MASAGPREDEKIDDWVNQMDTILGNLGQVVQIASSGFVPMSACVFFLDEFVCRQFYRLVEVFGVHKCFDRQLLLF